MSNAQVCAVAIALIGIVAIATTAALVILEWQYKRARRAVEEELALHELPIQNTTPTSALWETVRNEIHDLDRFGPDWDGEGAEPVPQELIHATMRFCKILEENGYLAPVGSIYALPDGTVMVECADQRGVRLSANIRGSGRIEMLYKAPGREPEFEILSMNGEE